MIRMMNQSRLRHSAQVEAKVQNSVVDLHSVLVMLAQEHHKVALKVQLHLSTTSILWEDLEPLVVLETLTRILASKSGIRT